MELDFASCDSRLRDIGSAAVQVHWTLAGQSVSLLRQLQGKYPQTQFALIGDSAFESCCVDEVAAKHIGAEVVVHIGYACGCKGRLETVYISEHYPLDLSAVQACLSSVPAPTQLQLDSVFPHTSLSVPVENAVSVLYVAAHPDSPELQVFLHRSKLPVYVYFPVENRVLPPHSGFYHFLSQRMTHIDAARTARVFGVLIASIPVYMATKDRLIPLLQSHGKEYYLIYLGKITPQKLMNFQDIDIFIRVSCPFARSVAQRDYFKPIISPWELECSLTEAAPDTLELDYRECLGKPFPRGPAEDEETALSIYTSEAAARYELRTYKGLQEPTNPSETLVKPGQSGFAQHYQSEGI